MKIRWRKINNILHRDLGYFFVGMTLIYAISGIALNHIADWNPSYEISHTPITWDQIPDKSEITTGHILNLLDQYGQKENYKKHYFPAPDLLKIFIKQGSVQINLQSGQGLIELLERRPLFFEVNYLHYNPRRLWTWFSDIFCVALIIISITGLFILKGKKGITGRGAWLTGAGIIVPIVFLLFYL
jgi:hypothetical protein